MKYTSTILRHFEHFCYCNPLGVVQVNMLNMHQYPIIVLKWTLNIQETDLDPVGAWGRQWNVLFTKGKCVHVQFSSNFESVAIFQCPINGSTITNCNHITKTLVWLCQMAKTFGMIRRAFKTSSIPAKHKPYLSLVHSRLSYCFPVWRPQHARDSVSLERVQRRATKYILNDYTSASLVFTPYTFNHWCTTLSYVIWCFSLKASNIHLNVWTLRTMSPFPTAALGLLPTTNWHTTKQ